MAPVTKRSGKTCTIVMRCAAQARLRQAVFHWARVAVQHDPKKPRPLRGDPGAWPLVRSRPARRRRPGARGHLRPAAASHPVRPRPRHAGRAVTTGIPWFDCRRYPVVPACPWQSVARKRFPGGRASSWTAQARRYVRRVGTTCSKTRHSAPSQPIIMRLTKGRESTLVRAAPGGFRWPIRNAATTLGG